VSRPITADLIARAVVAAARSLHIDPVRAVTAKRGGPRLALTAAALALAETFNLDNRRAGRLLGLDTARARCRTSGGGGGARKGRRRGQVGHDLGSPRLTRAVRAARRALKW
jgi:hypothetical protein